ncbi:esterase/lipase family protein [Gordonia sp. NPDC003376]
MAIVGSALMCIVPNALAAAAPSVRDDTTIPVVGVAPNAVDRYGTPTGPEGPRQSDRPTAWAYANAHEGANPQGANLRYCHEQERNPIVLVPGTGEDAYTAWAAMSPRLVDEGYCVYTFNANPTTVNGRAVDQMAFTGDVRASARDLARFVDHVLAVTGRPEVDIVGYSQGGGVLPLAYFAWYGGAAKTDHLIALAGSVHGTDIMGIAHAADELGVRTEIEEGSRIGNQYGWTQQLQGSDLIRELTTGRTAVAGPRYTFLSTRFDDVIIPFQNTQVHEPGVRNIIVQDVCRADTTDHFAFPYDPAAMDIVVNVLRGDRNPTAHVSCSPVVPFVGPVSGPGGGAGS